MKNLLFIFFPILLTSCTSVDSIFRPIQTIKCKQRGNSGYETTYTAKDNKNKVVIFNKNTGELFFYDDFLEALTRMSEDDATWIKSTIVNGKLKINQGSKRVWGKASIDLKNLTGEYVSNVLDENKNVEWDLKCVKVKNLSTKIK